ncbi:MAG: hypothetical protein PHP44_12500 [Kiritimatiellae bacterium]|nr:hypothetical protein [Kiritimatiellia bacterium]MDD4736910.1 hypothetical protein [Kiritimatiellia bacterium]
MSFQSSRLQEWEKRLKRVFDEIDDVLEKQYGGDYPLHPSRAERGATSNREHDGLFNIGAAFSAGYGSEHGSGYVVEVGMSTLVGVEESVREQLEEEVIKLLREKLPDAFPGRELQVLRDGSVYKIVGDLSF